MMYNAPLDDMRFALNHVVDLPGVTSAIGKEDSISPDLVDAILEEAGKLATGVIATTNRDGDVSGARRNDDGLSLIHI